MYINLETFSDSDNTTGAPDVSLSTNHKGDLLAIVLSNPPRRVTIKIDEALVAIQSLQALRFKEKGW